MPHRIVSIPDDPKAAGARSAKFLAATERMRVIGRLSASMKTTQQQDAIARVDNRVDTLRKHRGTPTKKRGGKLRGSDDQNET